ncbi:MAG: TetR/AcrR family transcriptional regulator [Propionibacteriaceae bacterium]
MPKQVDHEQRRAEIAIGVVRVIAEQGLAAVSLRSVAAATEVSMGRVQHYFTNKGDLVRHACRMFVEQAQGRSGESADDLRHLLTMGLPASAEERVGSAVWYTFVAAAATDDELAEIIREAWTQLGRSITAGVAEAADAPYLTDTLAALVDGLTLRVMLGQASPERARAVIDWHLAHWSGDRD